MAESNGLATLDENVQSLRYSTAPVWTYQQGCLMQIASGWSYPHFSNAPQTLDAQRRKGVFGLDVGLALVGISRNTTNRNRTVPTCRAWRWLRRWRRRLIS